MDGKVGRSALVSLKTGFTPGRTYELTYQTRIRRSPGSGFAAVRDLASAFKYNPDAMVKGRYAYAFGRSQTGRFLRAVPATTGSTPTSAIARRSTRSSSTSPAERSAASTSTLRSRTTAAFFTTVFPYRVQDGARSGDREDGRHWSARAEGRRAEDLRHATLDRVLGRQPRRRAHARLARRHGRTCRTRTTSATTCWRARSTAPDGFLPLQTNGQLRGNTNDYRWAQRALLVALDDWVRKGMHAAGEPASEAVGSQRWSRSATSSSRRFAASSGRTAVPGGYRSDLGGSPTSHPLPFLVPQVDADGNETGGIRLPEVAVPLAATTGWAFRSERMGAPTQLITNTGSYIPFAATRAEREKNGDPRPSVAERYSGRADYLQRVEAAARRLADERYVLTSDIPTIVERAGRHWDLLVTKGGRRRQRSRGNCQRGG